MARLDQMSLPTATASTLGTTRFRNHSSEQVHGHSGIMFENLRALAQPGAIVAIALVLLLMAVGDAAITIAVKGWPPL
ncbi:hypothetical protein FXB40_36665 [Bradyrhizobium rifense]|uniref:Uncharacterized protein n=1 Tax=Bradyrhizobium rifense TaxID=515499 RepID=A0A5D3K4T9_9BRAD|nr:hypothetical protein [Bradyrhizobium rifense]TYL89128.1 hypothetical protein FXB40_36665 [Bradyrhizobium rifense]